MCIHALVPKSSNQQTQVTHAYVYIHVKCNQSSGDFRNWPLRCSHIAQLASQSLHTFFASLSSYINFEAVCTTGSNMLFIHYLQCKHNMFSDIICARKGLQSKPLIPFTRGSITILGHHIHTFTQCVGRMKPGCHRIYISQLKAKKHSGKYT